MIVRLLLITVLAGSLQLSADIHGEVTAGGFISFKNRDTGGDAFSPSTTDIRGFVSADPADTLLIWGDLFLLYGFPDTERTMVFSSHTVGATRLALSWTPVDKKTVKISTGIVSDTQLFDHRPSRSTPVRQGTIEFSPFSGRRRHFIREEGFLHITLFDRIFISVDSGFDSRRFTVADPGASGTIHDVNYLLFSDTSVMILPFLEPFISFSLFDDMNSRDHFNRTDTITGFRGAVFSTKTITLNYTLGYRHLSSGVVTENHRLLMGLRARLSLVGNLSLFIWSRQEYTAADDPDKTAVRYLQRSISLAGRYLFPNNRLSVNAGITALIEQDNTGVHLPLWPFIEISYRSTTVSLSLRYMTRFRQYRAPDSTRHYGNTQNRLDAEISYRISFLRPFIGFRMNMLSHSSHPRTLGMTAGLETTF